MSDSVPETGGDTGEVVDASAAALATEDQEAEEQLHDIMQQEDPDELKRQVDHWKKAAQRHERTARDNSGAAKRLREMEDANKSELQKAVDAQQAAERERDAVRGDRDRMLAAAAHDLDPDLIDFLGTGTEEDINARAEVLAGIITKAAQRLVDQTGQPNGARASATGARARPVASLRPGAAPASQAPSSNEEMFRQLVDRNRST